MNDDAAARRRVLLDTLARAIDETRALRRDGRHLEFPLVQLEDIQARVLAHERLSDDYRDALSFGLAALRALEATEEEHFPYFDLLHELKRLIERY